MNATLKAQLVERRQKQKQKIMANPAGFKVCAVCTSISAKDAPVCPVCHSYRWLHDPAIVDVVVAFCVAHPFPFTTATAPRIKPA